MLSQNHLAQLRLTTTGFILQHVHLLDNADLPADLAGSAPRDELNERSAALTTCIGVAELADRDVSEASGDREEGPYRGAHLEVRYAALTGWLLAQEA